MNNKNRPSAGRAHYQTVIIFFDKLVDFVRQKGFDIA